MKIEVTKGYHSDAESIALMVYSAGPEIYDFIYSVNGKTALSFLVYEYLKGTGMTGYKNLTLAMDGNKVVGTGTFYNSVDLLRMSAQTISTIFRFYGFRSGLKVLSRIRHISSIIRQPGPKEIHIANLGVKEEYRGKGVGTKLISSQKRIAQKKGYKSMSLDVDTENLNAQRLYERLGFIVGVRNKEFSGNAARRLFVNEMSMLL